MQKLKDENILIQLSKSAFFSVPHSHGFKIGYAFLERTEMDEAIEKVAWEIKRQMNL